MAETVSLNSWLVGEEKKKILLPRSPASRGRPQRAWVATGLRRIDYWVSQKVKIKAGPCRANPWFAGGITSSGELALYIYLDLSLPISLSAAKP